MLFAILNVTPDSFSDGGAYFAQDRAFARAFELAQEGADILDVGGESTRPGSEAVGAQEEIRRVVPLIERLRAAAFPLPISVDTTKAEVARAALAAGAELINDISGGSFEPEILGVAAEADAGFVLMHTAGPPKTMQQTYAYDDVVGEIEGYLAGRLDAALAVGLKKERLLLDPGLCFGKSPAHNLALLRNAGRFARLGCPVLIGASRKSFIGALSGASTGERLEGSLAALALAHAATARVFRVHDVLASRRFLALLDAAQKGD